MLNNALNVDLEDRNSRIYMFAMEVLNTSRIDKKMLMFKTFVNLLPLDFRANERVAKLSDDVDKLLKDRDMRAKIELYYFVCMQQEEAKLLFDARRKYDDVPVYRLDEYPFDKINEMDIRIHDVIGEIMELLFSANKINLNALFGGEKKTDVLFSQQKPETLGLFKQQESLRLMDTPLPKEEKDEGIRKTIAEHKKGRKRI